MRTRTIVNIIDDVRSQIDEANSINPTDAELTEWFNQEWCEVYEKLADAGENYFLTTATFPTVSGTADYALPSDHFKTKGVSIQYGGTQFFPAHRFNFAQRDDFQLSDWSWPRKILYDLWGQSLHFLPTPSGAYTVKHYYYPPPVRLVSGADSIDGVNGWEMPAIFGTCSRAALKLENYELAQAMDMKKAARMADMMASLSTRNDGEAPMPRVVRGRPSARGLRSWWRGG